MITYSLNKMEEPMGIEISDEELLSMEPELLLRLQEYLKNFRENNKHRVTENLDKENEEKFHIENEIELNVIKSWHEPIGQATFEEVETNDGKFLGTRVTQNGRTYIARKWEITAEIKDILSKAAELGFSKYWRHGQPQNAYFLGGKNYYKGSPHISCSRKHSDYWVFGLDEYCRRKESGKQILKEITFNKLYGIYWETALTGEPQNPTEGKLVQGSYKIQNFGGQCFRIHPDDFEKALVHFSENYQDED